MKGRIEIVMKKERLTASKLAEIANIQRSAMSHILSGRNRPSLDIALKILEAFPTLNSDWLIRGIGPMYKEETPNTTLLPNSGFESEIFSAQRQDNPENFKENELSAAEKISNISDNQPFTLQKSTSKSVTKIVVFYSDGTFDSFGIESNSILKR
ncbi:MAG: helix-turn-helix domain-containing protein [Bacteroidales bacterium]|jgi:transcriptional regulator with XRE-family HTH domain|nr:helix-turn-helix domain-containing protein [Bacteroidales bacterium]